ncbi:YdcH family protein [Acetobacteraceae bacterium H6797]|nr:YdcH family protein [Acetobacteraceae bacterium H6797]
MSTTPRLRSLEERHAQLDQRIFDEDNRPMPNAAEITKLKQQKLRLKEEMHRLRGGQ